MCQETINNRDIQIKDMTEENERLKKLVEENAANKFNQSNSQPQFETQI